MKWSKRSRTHARTHVLTTWDMISPPSPRLHNQACIYDKKSYFVQRKWCNQLHLYWNRKLITCYTKVNVNAGRPTSRMWNFPGLIGLELRGELSSSCRSDMDRTGFSFMNCTSSFTEYKRFSRIGVFKILNQNKSIDDVFRIDIWASTSLCKNWFIESGVPALHTSTKRWGILL